MSHQTDDDRIIGYSELKNLIPYSRMTLWRLERQGAFPHRVQLGANRIGWSLAEVREWLALKKSQRGI